MTRKYLFIRDLPLAAALKEHQPGRISKVDLGNKG